MRFPFGEWLSGRFAPFLLQCAFACGTIKYQVTDADTEGSFQVENCLVFFDADGTLLFFNRFVSPRTAEQVNRLRSAGHRVFINSGRSRALIGPELTDLIPFDGFVCGSTYVEYHGEILHAKRLDVETVRAVCRFCMENGVRGVLEGEREVYSVCGGVFYKTADITLDITDRLDEYMADPDEMRLTKVTFSRPLTPDEAALFPALRIINFEYKDPCSEGILAGYTKAFGMELLAKKFSVPRERIVAFGDSVNDIEMLQYAGTSVIMQSADHLLDAFATFRTESDAEGVAEGIEKLFFKERL